MYIYCILFFFKTSCYRGSPSLSWAPWIRLRQEVETQRDATAVSAMMRTAVPVQEAASQEPKFPKFTKVSLNVLGFFIKLLAVLASMLTPTTKTN